MADSSSVGPSAHGDVEVEEVVAVGLDHRPGAQMGVGLSRGHGRVEVGDHLDPDRRATEAGLDDVGTREAGGRAVSASSRHPGQDGQPAPAATAAEGQLVHAQAAPATLGPV